MLDVRSPSSVVGGKIVGAGARGIKREIGKRECGQELRIDEARREKRAAGGGWLRSRDPIAVGDLTDDEGGLPQKPMVHRDYCFNNVLIS